MPVQRSLTRRRALAIAGSAAVAGGLTAPRLVYAQQKHQIKFTLPWVAEGSTLYTYVAKGMGFWDKHGLDVDIARGSGSVASAQAIGEGRFDFGLSTPSISIPQAIKGLPIVSIACCSYDATMGVCVMNDGPIKTPKDLEGHTIASVLLSADYPFFAPFAEKTGIDTKKITRIQVDNKVRNRLLPDGKVDAITGFASSVMPVYAATGVKAHFMLYSDFGLVNYGTTVMTQPQRIASEPQLCAAFTDGLLEALKFTMLSPEEGLDVFLKQVPELALAPHAREEARVGVGILIYTVARDLVKEHGVGYMDPKDFDIIADMVMKYLAKPGDSRPDLTKLMTDQFVGKVQLSPTEWQQVLKNAAEFKVYVS